MTSVERIEEYCHLESEGPATTDVQPPDSWPSKGQIMFDDMSFSYHKALPNVLHHVTCIIKPNEKVHKTILHGRAEIYFIVSMKCQDILGLTCDWLMVVMATVISLQCTVHEGLDTGEILVFLHYN